MDTAPHAKAFLQRFVRCSLAALLVACGESATTAAPGTTKTPTTTIPGPALNPATSTLTIVAGNAQLGVVQDQLAAPVSFQLNDILGNPLVGVAVRLTVTTGGGSVPTAIVTTDASGQALTPWILGPTAGAQVLEAEANGLPAVLASATASACGAVDCALAVAPAIGQWNLLTLQTYEGSGQVTHPDVTVGPGGRWLWMAITPYPGGNSANENPSIFQSANGIYWRIPKGLTNPVALPTSGYFSDPDITYDSTSHRFWMYYRQVVNGNNVILLTRSMDGVTWDSSRAVVTVPNHYAVSPAVVRSTTGTPWTMWSVNSYTAGCSAQTTNIERRTSNDGMHWTAAAATDLYQNGQIIWHIEVQWIPARSEYWAVYNTYPIGSNCATNALYIARSPDGIHWTTYPSPIVSAGATDAFQDIVYRSTFLANATADTVRLWIAGAKLQLDYTYSWHTETAVVSTDGLFTSAAQGSIRSSVIPAPRNLPPPEPDH